MLRFFENSGGLFIVFPESSSDWMEWVYEQLQLHNIGSYICSYGGYDNAICIKETSK